MACVYRSFGRRDTRVSVLSHPADLWISRRSLPTVPAMRLLILGAGGVGSAAALIAARRPFLTYVVLADYDAARAAAGRGRGRRRAVRRRPARRLRRRRRSSALIPADRIDAVLGATDPRFTMPIFRAALAAGVHYLDMAMSLSQPHPERPVRRDRRQARRRAVRAGRRVGGSRPARAGRHGRRAGLADVFARYAADHLFSRDRRGRACATARTSSSPGYDFAPSFSIWTTIEECLNPPVIYEKDRGLVHHRAVQRAGGLRLPGGHRPGGVRQRRARGGAAHPALGRRQAG